ncbi:hypothetical protein ACTFIR_009727 [Dictyostelium discoideum]
MDKDTHNFNYNYISEQLGQKLTTLISKKFKLDEIDDSDDVSFFKNMVGSMYDRRVNTSKSWHSYRVSEYQRFLKISKKTYYIKNGILMFKNEGNYKNPNSKDGFKVLIGAIPSTYHFKNGNHFNIQQMIEAIRNDGFYITIRDIRNSFKNCNLCELKKRKPYKQRVKRCDVENYQDEETTEQSETPLITTPIITPQILSPSLPSSSQQISLPPITTTINQSPPLPLRKRQKKVIITESENLNLSQVNNKTQSPLPKKKVEKTKEHTSILKYTTVKASTGTIEALKKQIGERRKK